MPSLQKTKEEMHLNLYMMDLMETLKGIAVAEYWALFKKQGHFKRFTDAFNGFFNILDFSSVDHPFARNTGKLVILMITSNEGFMGGLNARVINAALAHKEAEDAAFITIGEQGAIQLGALNRQFKAFPGIVLEECYNPAVQLRNYIVEEAGKGTLNRLVVYYPKSISFMVQRVEELTILPCTELFKRKEKLAPEEVEGLIIESSLYDMIQYLVETWIIQKFYEIFEESKLAEFSARTVHLEESFQLLQERGKGIRFQYLRSWHELIDKGMRDIFSAQIIRRKVKKRSVNELMNGKSQ